MYVIRSMEHMKEGEAQIIIDDIKKQEGPLVLSFGATFLLGVATRQFIPFINKRIIAMVCFDIAVFGLWAYLYQVNYGVAFVHEQLRKHIRQKILEEDVFMLKQMKTSYLQYKSFFLNSEDNIFNVYLDLIELDNWWSKQNTYQFERIL